MCGRWRVGVWVGVTAIAVGAAVRTGILNDVGDLSPLIPIPQAPGPAPHTSPPRADEVAHGPNVPDVCTGGVLRPGGRLQPFANSLRRGETGCLRRGVYKGGVDLRRRDVTLRNYPGARPTISGGQVRISPEATGAAVTGLRLISDRFSPLVYASHAVIADNEITNHHTDICVLIDRYPGTPPPRGVVIRDNRIHDCGKLPATNHDHGIYVDTAREAVIRDNLIYDNADRGVQLYPQAEGTQVIRNVIDGNGQGIIFGNSSDHSVVRRNIISNSTIRHNIESSASTGTDNVVRHNCLWSARDDYYGGDPAHSGVLPDRVGFRLGPNVVADPRFRDRVNFRPAKGSRCAAMGPKG
jgi:Right handed beta helix region